jgi:hypothetical protein
VSDELASNQPAIDRLAIDSNPIDLEVVRREIEADARERRRSGVYPPGFEEELAELFARFSPAAASGDLGALIDDAEEHGLIEPFIPIESQKPAGRFVKQGFAKALGWYHTWLTQEISQFAGASVRALRVTADKLAAIERRLGHADRHAALLAEVAFDGPSDHEVSIVLEHLARVRGRTLVARGGDGRLVAALVARGCDVYGIEPDAGLRDRAENLGVDLLPDDTDRHLSGVRSGTLGAVVLIGPDVDATSVGSRLELIERALRALGVGGLLVIVATRPDAYQRRQPIGSDLGAARPFGGSTWRTLLQRAGAPSIEEFAVAEEMLLIVARRDEPASSVRTS